MQTPEDNVRIERSIRLGEIVMMAVTVIGLIGGWFALQTQVQANTQTINKNLRMIDKLNEAVTVVRDYQIRQEAYQAGFKAGEHEEQEK